MSYRTPSGWNGPKFEYKVAGLSSLRSWDEEAAIMNALGNEGWEIVSVENSLVFWKRFIE